MQSLIGQKQNPKINTKKWIRELEDINNVIGWFNASDLELEASCNSSRAIHVFQWAIPEPGSERH